MPLPLLPDPTRPDAWRRGQFLPAGEQPRYLVRGWPGYYVENRTLYRAAYTDKRGRRRSARAVKRCCASGCFGFWLRRNHVSVWVGIKRLKGLLEKGA